MCKGWLEFHLTPEKPLGIESAEYDLGVGNGRKSAALSVASRSGLGSGASRSDLEGAVLINPTDAATSRANRLDIDGREAHGRAKLDLELVVPPGLSINNQGHVGARAAHVEGDDVLEAGESSEPGAADDTAGGTRPHQPRGPAAQDVGCHETAGALHQQRLVTEAGILNPGD